MLIYQFNFYTIIGTIKLTEFFYMHSYIMNCILSKYHFKLKFLVKINLIGYNHFNSQTK